jgi:hypothetical protein
MEFIGRFWDVSWAHLSSHLSYFTGLTMLLPTLSKAWDSGISPWKVYPWTFGVAIALLLLGICILFRIERSIGKIFRSVGWMMVIPGILAIIFTVISSESAFAMAQDSITGFSVVEPTARWIFEHKIPNTLNVGAGYLLFGVCSVWVGNRLGRLAEYL